MPTIPFMGVRISWLMLARNSLLARFATSARSFAATRSAVRAFTSASAPSRAVTTDAVRDLDTDCDSRRSTRMESAAMTRVRIHPVACSLFALEKAWSMASLERVLMAASDRSRSMYCFCISSSVGSSASDGPLAMRSALVERASV